MESIRYSAFEKPKLGRVNSIEWYNTNKDEYGDIRFKGNKYVFTPQMSRFCGQTVEFIGMAYDSDTEERWLIARGDARSYMWRWEMLVFGMLT